MTADATARADTAGQGPVRHFTATGYVVNAARTRMLLVRHRRLGFWLPAGGHLDPNELPHEAAVREVLEETGVHARLVQLGEPVVTTTGPGVSELPRPWVMLEQHIPATAREPEHTHLDLCYLLEADDSVPPLAQDTEVSAARWWDRATIGSQPDVADAVRSFARLHLT
jgi:8-oxo-dGTP diphosphatase